MPVKPRSKRIAEGLTALIKGTGDMAEETVALIRESTTDSLRTVRKRAGTVSQVAVDMITHTIQTASDAGGELESMARDAVKGVIEAAAEVTRVTPDLIADAVRAAVRSARKVGGDVPQVSRSAVEGAIDAGKQAGLKPEEAASVAATAAVEAADEISPSMGNAVAKAVSGTVSGVKITPESLRKAVHILLVDTNRTNMELLAQQLGKEGYQTHTASSLEEMDHVLGGERKPALAIVDLSGFDQSIWDHCDRLSHAGVPFLVISPRRSLTIQRDSMKRGAAGLLIKPIGTRELIEYVHTLLGDQ